MPKPLDALVIGAGPAGIGQALALDAIEDLTFGIVEKGKIGQTFLDWPKYQRFLTPSFTTNGFSGPDLNAVDPLTSPAHALGTDYPTGPEYAAYLKGVAGHFALPVLDNTAVTSIHRDGDLFLAHTPHGPVPAKNIIYAGGEFGHPQIPRFPGGEHAVHSSDPDAWEFHGEEIVVIGGYESGLDIASHHVQRGAKVTVIDPNHPWEYHGSDPSFTISARTRRALRRSLATERLTFLDAGARAITQDKTTGKYVVSTTKGRRVATTNRPIAATGFAGNFGPVEKFFERTEGGWANLDDTDQSTLTPGVFLTGPGVRHDDVKFCFIYKFRGRFAHVARTIGEKLGYNCDALSTWKDAGMLLDDLSCCGTSCAC